MLAIRMRRSGAKKRPFYRVVVIDSHKARDGRALEVLGHYNPATVPEIFKIDRERFDHWLARGAQPSDTLRTLLMRPQTGGSDVGGEMATPVVQVAVPSQVVPAGPATDDVAESPGTDEGEPSAEGKVVAEETVSEGEFTDEDRESTDS